MNAEKLSKAYNRILTVELDKDKPFRNFAHVDSICTNLFDGTLASRWKTATSSHIRQTWKDVALSAIAQELSLPRRRQAADHMLMLRIRTMALVRAMATVLDMCNAQFVMSNLRASERVFLIADNGEPFVSTKDLTEMDGYFRRLHAIHVQKYGPLASSTRLRLPKTLPHLGLRDELPRLLLTIYDVLTSGVKPSLMPELPTVKEHIASSSKALARMYNTNEVNLKNMKMLLKRSLLPKLIYLADTDIRVQAGGPARNDMDLSEMAAELANMDRDDILDTAVLAAWTLKEGVTQQNRIRKAFNIVKYGKHSD